MKQSALAFKIFSFIFLCIHCFAQTAEECQYLAKQAEANDQVSFCLSIYERLQYFTPDKLSSTDYVIMARCYIKQRSFETASACFESAARLAHNDSLHSSLLLKAVWTKLMQQNFQEAQAIILGLPDDLPATLERERLFYSGIAYFGLERFKESEQSFIKYFPDKINQHWLRSIFAQNERLPRRYNARTAKLLSTIIPGSGQLYIGDIKNGINSFVLTTGLVALGINYIIYYSWLDSLISVAPWFQRYYAGGRNRAYQLARAKVQKKRQDLLNKIILR